MDRSVVSNKVANASNVNMCQVTGTDYVCAKNGLVHSRDVIRGSKGSGPLPLPRRRLIVSSRSCSVSNTQNESESSRLSYS